jgi:broad specificity phosphatase PhoE
MRRLTLIRHGLTAWNSEGRFQGRSDVPLTARGRAQAERLRARAARLEPVDAVLSSPSTRAIDTAAIAFPGHRPSCDERLRELDFGVFEGRTFAQNETHPAWSWWIADPYRRPAPRGESYGALQARAAAWLDEASGRWRDGHVVAVCHSGTIQMLLAHVLGVARPGWRVRLEVDNTSVSEVRFEGGHTIVERVNDVTHLVDEAAR